MSRSYEAVDLAIIGAGPAGLAAAITSREAGLRVTLLDDQLEPGGQIWRAAASTSLAHAQRMGKEYLQGRERVQRFQEGGATYLPRHIAWHIENSPDGVVVHAAGPKGGTAIRAEKLLLATGALERAVPIPGWTLPGVMTAGGLQILLKSARLSPDNAVLAGAGPLLWLLAAQMVTAGTPPRTVVECVAPSDYLAATKHLPSALRSPAPLKKGLALIAQVQRAGVAVYRGAKNLRIDGDLRVQALRFQDWRGREQRIETDLVALHTGVVPNQQATRLLRVPHEWSDRQHAFRPIRGDDMQVQDRIYLAGDGAGIGGADVAWLEGQIVASLLAGRDASALRRSLTDVQATRPFIDRLYLPARHLRRPVDTTVLCRCENVTAGRVRQAVRDSAMGPNQVKFMLRPGMGPCQGRVCGLAVSEVIAEALGQDMNQAGYFRIRPPLKPVPLGVIAAELDRWAEPAEDGPEQTEATLVHDRVSL